MKCKEWIAIWLENYVKPTAKNRTYTKYADIARIRIVPKLGETEVEALTPLVLQQYVTDLLKHGNLKTHEGLSVNTVNATINVLQSSFKTACAVGITKEYTAGNIKRPKGHERKIDSFSVAEQRKIEQYILRGKNIRYYGVILGLYTGLRIGELLALTWRDVDFVKKLLYVSKSCYDGKDENGNFVRLVGDVKTEASNRVIPLPPKIMAMLKTLKQEAHTDYIVELPNCQNFSVRTYQTIFTTLLKRLDIAHKGFHALRHTFATRAIESGMDVKTLSEILGHKNPAVTLRRYVHSMMEHKREAMNKLVKMLQMY